MVKEQCTEIPGQECNVVETEVCEQVPSYIEKLDLVKTLKLRKLNFCASRFLRKFASQCPKKFARKC